MPSPAFLLANAIGSRLTWSNLLLSSANDADVVLDVLFLVQVSHRTCTYEDYQEGCLSVWWRFSLIVLDISVAFFWVRGILLDLPLPYMYQWLGHCLRWTFLPRPTIAWPMRRAFEAISLNVREWWRKNQPLLQKVLEALWIWKLYALALSCIFIADGRVPAYMGLPRSAVPIGYEWFRVIFDKLGIFFWRRAGLQVLALLLEDIPQMIISAIIDSITTGRTSTLAVGNITTSAYNLAIRLVATCMTLGNKISLADTLPSAMLIATLEDIASEELLQAMDSAMSARTRASKCDAEALTEFYRCRKLESLGHSATGDNTPDDHDGRV